MANDINNINLTATAFNPTEWFNRYLKTPFPVISFFLAMALFQVIRQWRIDVSLLNEKIVQCEKEAKNREIKNTEEHVKVFTEMLNTQENIFSKSIDLASDKRGNKQLKGNDK